MGHKDFSTAICPSLNPLPGIGRPNIDRIVDLASQILRAVCLHYTGGDLNFHPVSIGGVEPLIFWLKAGQEHHSRAYHRVQRPPKELGRARGTAPPSTQSACRHACISAKRPCPSAAASPNARGLPSIPQERRDMRTGADAFRSAAHSNAHISTEK